MHARLHVTLPGERGEDEHAEVVARGELVRAGAKVADDASDEALQPKGGVAPPPSMWKWSRGLLFLWF